MRGAVMNFVIPTRRSARWDDDEECHGETPNMVIRKHLAEVVEMPPREFLRLADPGFRPAARRTSDFRRRSVEFILEAIRKGECFAPLQLWPFKARSYGLKHEGRHRAWVAAKLGIKKVPVYLWYE